MPEKKARIIRGTPTDDGFAYRASDVLVAPGGSFLDGMPNSKPPVSGASTFEEPGYFATPNQLKDARYQGTLGEDLGTSAVEPASQRPRRRTSGRVK